MQKFLPIRGRLSCYQQSRPFESWIPGEALPTLNAAVVTWPRVLWGTRFEGCPFFSSLKLLDLDIDFIYPVIGTRLHQPKAQICSALFFFFRCNHAALG